MSVPLQRVGPRRTRRLLAAVLVAFAISQASAQTVRLAPILSPMAGLVVAPAPLQTAAPPIMSLSPAAPLVALSLAGRPVPAAPAAVDATPLPLAVRAPLGALAGLRDADRRARDAKAPAREGEWRLFFDGGLQASRVASVPTAPSAGVRGRGLAPGTPPPAARTARPTPGLSVQPSPAPKAPPAWKKMIGSRSFWMTASVILPGGFVILGAYWLYQAIAAYLRRHRRTSIPG